MIGIFYLLLAMGFAFAYNNKCEEIERIKNKLPLNIKMIYQIDEHKDGIIKQIILRMWNFSKNRYKITENHLCIE